MWMNYRCSMYSNYSIKNWTRGLVWIIFVISALCVLVEGAAVCPSGWMPPNCQNPCGLGYFGSDCVFPCPTTCTNRACQPDSGFCYQCQLGFIGPNCSNTCHRGFFGQDCNNTCPTGCFRQHCDPFTGLCDKCVPGYEGVRCEIYYLLHNHTNQTYSSLSLGDMLNRTQQMNTYVNTLIYISAAVVICVMSLCSVASCNYLVKLKARQQRLTNMPIYKKASLNVLPSAFLRRPRATTAHEYVEMNTTDEEYGTIGEADVKPNIVINSLPDTNAGKCTGSASRNHGKLLYTLMKMGTGSRDDKSFAMLAKDTEEIELKHDDIDTPELSNILKINAPLRVEQAANYSRDLYFKSYLPYQRFRSGSDDPRIDVTEQQELCSSFPPGDRLGALALVREKNSEADTTNWEMITESRQRTPGTMTGRWYRSKPNSQIFVFGESDFMPRDGSQKSSVKFNLAGDLVQDGKHHVVQAPRDNCPSADSSGVSTLPHDSDQTVLHTGVTTQSEKNDDHATVPEVTDGNRAKVYAETTEPLSQPNRLLWRVRKTFATFISRAVKSLRTRVDYETVVSGDQERAVQKLELTKLELTETQSELEGQGETEKSMFLCNCLDCELETEERKFDSEFACRGFQSQIKNHYKGRVISGVTASADNNKDDTTNLQQISCSTAHRSDADCSGINKSVVVAGTRQLDYLQTDSSDKSQTSTYVINDSKYNILSREYVRRLVSQPENDVYSQINDNTTGKKPCGVSQDNEVLPLANPSHNHLFSKRSLADDATNNFSFCCANKKPCPGDHMINDQVELNDTPRESVSCSELSNQLSDQRKRELSHNPCTGIYDQQRFHEPGEVCMMYTTRSSRRHSFTDKPFNPDKGSLPDICGTSFKNATNINKFARKKIAYLDTSSMEAFKKTNVIVLTTLQARMKHTSQANKRVDYLDDKFIPGKSHSCVPEIKLDTRVARSCTKETAAEASPDNQESQRIIRNWNNPPLPSSYIVDENPQGSNIGCDLGEYVSLIPKSVIALTVRKQPNREIKTVYTGDLDLPLTNSIEDGQPRQEE